MHQDSKMTLKSFIGKYTNIPKFEIVGEEGQRKISRDIEHYNLDVIISVAYRVKSKQGK